MNALVSQEAKAKTTLCVLNGTLRPHDGRREDGDDLQGAVARREEIGRWQGDVLHDGKKELQPS